MKECLQKELCTWSPALQIRPTKTCCRAPPHSITPQPQEKPRYTKLECVSFMTGLVEPTGTALLFSVYNTIFPKEGKKEAKKLCSAAKLS